MLSYSKHQVNAYLFIFTEVMGSLTWLVDGQGRLGRGKPEFREFLLYSTWLGRPISISSEAVLAWLPSTSLDSGFALLEKIHLCGKMFVGQRYLHSRHVKFLRTWTNRFLSVSFYQACSRQIEWQLLRCSSHSPWFYSTEELSGRCCQTPSLWEELHSELVPHILNNQINH